MGVGSEEVVSWLNLSRMNSGELWARTLVDGLTRELTSLGGTTFEATAAAF